MTPVDAGVQRKMATLVGPGGERVAVESDSQQAQQYFGQGYTLETAKAPVASITEDTGSDAPVTGDGTSVDPTAGGGASTSTGTGVMGSNAAFMAAFGTIMGKGTQIKQYQDQKNALLTQLYDRKLSSEEIQGLSPAQQAAIRGNDKAMIEFQIRSLNDAAKGRATENTTTLQYMLEGYNMDLAQAETLRQEAEAKKSAGITNLLALAEKYNLSELDPGLVERLQAGELTGEDAVKLSEVLSAQQADTTESPSSYDEWSLAGGEEGTGMSYAAWLTRKDSTGQKDFTDVQAKNADFAYRMENAYANISELAPNLTAWELSTEAVRPEFMRSQEYKQYLAAEQEFINAILRRESGAAVPDAERLQYRRSFIPMAGDDEETRAAKKEAADRAILGTKNASQGAYEAFYGTGGEEESTEDGNFIKVDSSYQSVDDLLTDHPELKSAVQNMRDVSSDEEILQLIAEDGGIAFSSVGGDTKTSRKIAAYVAKFDEGDRGGQCGRYVNQGAGTRMGDTYASKMKYVNLASAAQPKGNDIFVMPYKGTGHTGFVAAKPPPVQLEDGSWDFWANDSNYHLDERVDIHKMNSKDISGYARLS